MRRSAAASGCGRFFSSNRRECLAWRRRHALSAACALECVHCYSLVHDDLPSMDDDAVRRGRPTLHIAFDEATAILAGDALLTLAFEILSDPQTHPDPAIRAELILLLAKAGGWQGMALGQALDLSPARKDFGASDIAEMQALKTGALFRFACEAGAVLGRAEPSERAALVAYASSFGQAFQLADDLLDAQGDARALGKAVAKDEAKRQGDARRAARRPTPPRRGSASCCIRPKQPLRLLAAGLTPCSRRCGSPQTARADEET